MAAVIALGLPVGSVLRSSVAVAARVCRIATRRDVSVGLPVAVLVCTRLGSGDHGGKGGRHGGVSWLYVGVLVPTRTRFVG